MNKLALEYGFEPEESWVATRPYTGPDPVGHFLVYGVSDSDPAYRRANYDVICERLARAAGEDTVPRGIRSDGPFVLDVGGAFGKHRYIFIGADSSNAVVEEANDIIDSLAGYPILDDERAGDYELDEAERVWALLDVSERLEVIRVANDTSAAGVSIFAARHDTLPSWQLIGHSYLADL